MRLTFVLLAATVAGPLLAYFGYLDWLWAVLGLLVFGALLVRWVRRQPHPRLDKVRAGLAPRASSATTAIKTGDASRRQHGLASAMEIHRHGSAATVKKLAPVVRPSLAGERVTPDQVGVKLCKVGQQTVWASVEDFILAVAGPRSWKSSWLASSLVDYPGSAIATSLRPDLYTNTAHHRRSRGPVYVFNATSIDGLDKCVTFNPLTGCSSPEIAIERAEDMVPAATGEQKHWADLARSALASLMHAAALGDHSMDVVQKWVADPDQHKDTVIRLLRGSTSRAVVEDARQFFDCNDRTRSSITTSIMPALRWLQFSVARRAAGLDGDASPFRVEDLLDHHATLYVLGRVENATSPLMGALTGYVARNAERRAATTLTGRLDPPLGLHLDEAADSKPPLPQWTSTMGGSGITIKAVFQSRAQMIEAWGKEGAGIILNNAGAVMLGGGTKDPDDLSAWSELAGKRDERTETTDGSGKVTSASQRQVPVLPPSALANMPPGQVVVFRRGMLPAIGRVQMIWERRDLKKVEHLPVETTPGVETAISTPQQDTTPPPWRTPRETTTPPVETAVVDYLLPAPREEVETDAER